MVVNGVVNSPRYGESNMAVELVSPSVATVCGLHERKGVQDLIRAVAKSRASWHLYIVGEGPYRRELEVEAERLDIAARVHFVGFQSDPAPWIASADLFALVSHAEGGALVLTEARMVGAPILYTAVGDMKSMLRPRAGRAVAPADPGGISVALDEFAYDRGKLLSLASRSLEGLDYYSVERVNRDVLGVYREIRPDLEPTRVPR